MALGRWPYTRLWVGNTASGLATWSVPFVLGFLVLQRVILPIDLGVILALRTAGFLMGVLGGGVIADLAGRRGMILYSSALAAVGVLIIVLGVQAPSGPRLFLLVLGATVAGLGQGACRPAYQALIPAIVPNAGLQRANAFMSLSLRVSTLIGPTIATIAATTLGPAMTFVGIVLLWLVSASLPPWPDERLVVSGQVRASTGFGVLARLREGIDEARKHPWFLSALAALTLVIATGYSVSGVMVPVISDRVYGSSALLVATSTAYTAGGLLGAIVLSRWKPAARGWWALAGLGAYALVPLGLIYPHLMLLSLIAFFLAGVGIEIFNILWFTSVQEQVAPDKLARVSSLDFLLSYGLAPIGLAFVAPLSELIGINVMMTLTALLCLGGPLLAALVRSSRSFRV